MDTQARKEREEHKAKWQKVGTEGERKKVSRAGHREGQWAELQAAINNSKERVRRRHGAKPRSRGAPQGSKVRKQGPEEFARTPGGNGDKIRGVIRIRRQAGRA